MEVKFAVRDIVMFNTSLDLENSKPCSEFQWKCTLAYTHSLD